MPSLLDILNDPNYIKANEATKEAIFDKYAPLDEHFTNANEATKDAIRQRFGLSPLEPQTSGLSAFGHGVLKGALPTVAGIAGAGLTAPLGMGAGPVGMGVAGFGGAIAASSAAAAAQEKLLEAYPETAKFLGLDPETAAMEEKEHPYLSFAGEVAPNLMAFRPSAVLAKSAKNLTEKEAAQLAAEKGAALVNAGVGAGLGAGIEATQQQFGEEPTDYGKVGIQALAGLLGQKETKIGRGLTRVGELPYGAETKARINALRHPEEIKPIEESKRPITEIQPTVEQPSKSPSQDYEGMIGEIGGKKIEPIEPVKMVEPEPIAKPEPIKPVEVELVKPIEPEPIKPIETEPSKIAPIEPVKEIKTPVQPTAVEKIQTPISQDTKQIIEQNRSRDLPASIQQMNKIAANPMYEFVGVDNKMGSGAPIVTGPVKVPDVQLGKKSTAIAEDGTKIPIQYAVVSAKDILPSNKVDGTPNANYSPQYNGLRAVVGNGRAAGIIAAHERGSTGDYVTKLLNDDTHGINKEVIQSIPDPMLVRLAPEDKIPANIGDISNISQTLNLSTVEQAKNDSNRIDLSGIKFNENGDIAYESKRGFIQAMPESEQANLIDKEGRPTKQASDRLNAAIFQKAYGNDELTNLAHQAEDAEARNIINALSQAAPDMAKLSESSEYNLKPIVTQSAEMAINAKRNGISLADLAKQQDITAHPLTQNILELFANNSRSSKKIADGLKNIARGVNEEINAPAEDMFGMKPKRSLEEIIKEGLFKKEEPDLFGEAKAERIETPYSDKFFENEKKLYKDLRSALDKMGLKNVGLKLEDAVYANAHGKESPVNGTYLRKMMNLSLSGDNIFRSMGHEALHAMRDLGFFTDKEWKLLSEKAEKEWVKKYNIEKTYGDLPKEAQLEEAIAKAFADYRLEKPQVRSIMSKFVNVLKRIGNVFRGNGFKTEEDIFKIASEGKLKEGRGAKELAANPKYEKNARNIFNQPVDPTWGTPEVSKSMGLIRLFQDRHIDMKQVVAQIKKEMGELGERWDPYLKEGLFHSKTAEAIGQFERKEITPLAKEMDKLNVTNKELHDYLHNRHAEEFNKRMNKINPDAIDEKGNIYPYALKDKASGIHTDDARKYLEELDTKKKAALETLAKRVDAMIKEYQRILVESGQETQETIDKFNNLYPNYVPLFRQFENEGMPSTLSRKGVGVSGKFGKRAMGSEKEVQDIVSSVIGQREKAIINAEKIKVNNAVYGLAIKAPNPDFYLPVNPDAIKNPELLAAELDRLGINGKEAVNLMQEKANRVVVDDPKTGQSRVEFRVNPLERYKDNVLPIRINGQDRYVFFNERNPVAANMVKALRNMDTEQLNIVEGMVAKMTRWFAASNTQYNPVFGFVNFLRDYQGAMFNLTNTPIAGQQAKVTAGVFPAMKSIFRSIRAMRDGKEYPTDEWSQLYKDFREAGGQTLFRDSLTRKANEEKIIESKLKDLKSNPAKKGFFAAANMLSDFNDSIENAIRLSAYKTALDKGLSKDKAAMLAKELTVNFDRKGNLGQKINSFYAFFNASVQGSARLYETLKGPKGRMIIGGGIGMGVMQAVMLDAAGYDDKDIPEFIRQKNFIVPLSDGTYASIPYPMGLNLFPNTGRLATEFVLDGGKHAGKKTADFFGMTADTFNPLGGSSLSMQTILPTVFDPLAALEANKDSFGRPIYKADKATNPTPGYLRSREGASEISKSISEFLNYASGGTKYQKGAISPTADALDYLAGQITGGAGREIMKTEQTIKGSLNGDEVPSYRVPLAGRFYGETESKAAESARFYENITEMANHENEIKGRQKNKENVAEYMQENPEARLYKQANSVENQISALNKRKKALQDREAPKESIKAIDNQIQNQMKRFNDQVKSLQQ